MTQDRAEPSLDEESAWVRDARAGDRRAFAALVERYWDRLHRWLYHLTHDTHTAEDLTQETFLKAYAGLATLRPESNFRAWLFRIGYNTFASRRRLHNGTRQPLPLELVGDDEGPVDRLLSREALLLLARAVGRLPTEFRSAFLLRAEEGLSFRQIGEVLDLNEQTARWRVFKARQKLLQVLAPELFPPAFRPEASEPP